MTREVLTTLVVSVALLGLAAFTYGVENAVSCWRAFLALRNFRVGRKP